MKVSDYLPDLYKFNIEMNNIINSEEIELESGLKPDIDIAFKNNFVTTADEQGIEQFEKILNIEYGSGESLDFRKQRIFLRLNSDIPFTETYLVNQLNKILGKGNWSYNIDYNSYTLVVSSIIPGKNWKDELIAFLDRTIPCNIDWNIEYYETSWGVVYDNLTTWEDVYNIGTWQDIIDGEYI